MTFLPLPMTFLPRSFRFAARVPFRFAARGLLCLCGFLALPVTSVLAAHPLVASFERFGKADDLNAKLAGELLLSELSCTACHTSETLPSKAGPSLRAAGLRLHADWMTDFLLSPQRVKPGTTMPDVLQSLPAQQRQSVAQALVAFLATQRQPFQKIKASGAVPVPHQFWKRGDVQRGQTLYHQSGCVACHAADETYQTAEAPTSSLDNLLSQLSREELEEMGLADAGLPYASVPHAALDQKYTREGLTRFLHDPLAVRPSGRMPNMKLSVAEAADLAAYLLERFSNADGDVFDAPASSSKQPAAADPSDAKLVTAGRRWFSELRCVQCHAAQDVDTTIAPASPSLVALRSARSLPCGTASQPKVPYYPLSDAQRAALLTAIQSHTASDALEAQADATNGVHATDGVQLELLRQNCYACHARDGRGGVGRDRKPYFTTAGNVDLGDEGRLPPSLTGVGSKLTAPWLKRVLQGKQADLRNHMLARMPIFSHPVAASLPSLLGAADGAQPSNEQAALGDLTGLMESGRQLMDTGCVQCHAFQGETLPGVVGVELHSIDQRLRPEWFKRFLANPAELKPRTRMPNFFSASEGQNQDVLGGDRDRQIAAMWAYLKGSSNAPLPAKIEAARAQDFELMPSERPVLLRTFMHGVGQHAIAVGFPAQVHFAYDAWDCRPALLWRSRFLDAEGTWFVRFAPPADPLGDKVVQLPTGYSLVSLAPPLSRPTPLPAARFKGYRLDDAGVPTFLSHWNGLSVSERLEPIDGGLKRTWVLEGLNNAQQTLPIALRLHAAKELHSLTPRSVRDHQGVTILLQGEQGLPERRLSGDLQEWILKLPLEPDAAQATPRVQRPLKIEVRYQW